MNNNASEESVWCVVNLNGKDTLLVGCNYRSPNSDCNNNEKLNDTVRQANNLGFSYILIFRNVNYPSINWDDITSPPEGNHQSALFLEAVRDSFIWQHMAEPTHCTPNTLDLIKKEWYKT